MRQSSADRTRQGHQLLHVVNISFVIPYYLGGLTEFLHEHGIDTHVACSPAPDLDSLARTVGFRPFAVPVVREISPARDLRSAFALWAYVRRQHIDTVVGHTPKGGLLAALAGRLGGAGLVVYVRHGLVFETQVGWRRRVVVAMDRLTSLLSHRVVSVSPSVRDTAHALRLNPPSKSVLLGSGSFNGIDTGRFSPAAHDDSSVSRVRRALGICGDAMVVGYVGRLVKDKGIPELVRAWEQVRDEEPRAVLLLVGPPEERDAVSPELLEAIDRDPSIVATGLVEDTAPLYAAMDIFVLPSRREGLPTVVLEASASALPIVTTRATGCRDVVLDGVTGVLTDLNEEAVAASILSYLRDPEMRKRHGAAGRRFVIDAFDRRAVWEQFLQLVTAGRPTPVRKEGNP